MSQKALRFLKRGLFYALGFTLPPFFAAVLIGVFSISQVMVYKPPKPVAAAETAQPTLRSDRLTALFIVSNQGTEITDLLGPIEVLGASGKFNVVTAAPKAELSTLTGGAAILPHYSFADAPRADVLFVPAVLDSTQPALIEFVKKRAPEVKLLVSVCEGARLLAQGGLLRHKKFTTHFLSIPDLQKLEPTSKPQPGERYVEDGKILSSSGITGSIDAAFRALEILADGETARATAEKLGWPIDSRRRGTPRDSIRGREFVRIALNAAFDWKKKRTAVILYEGVSGLGLAAALDTLPRALSAPTFTVAAERKVLKSRHGLQLVAQHDPTTAPFPVLVVVPTHGPDKGAAAEAVAGRTEKLPTDDPGLHRYIVETEASVKSHYYDAPGKAFDQMLLLVRELYDKQVTRTIAKLIEYPAPAGVAEGETPFPYELWLRPLLIGFLGAFIVSRVERRFRLRAEARPE